MNNKTATMLAIVGCLTITQLGFASGRDTNVKTVTACTGYVTGGCTIGDITIGAVGDKVSIDVTGLSVENFGVIRGAMVLKSLTIPVSGKKLFAFTPTRGDNANRQIDVLFYTLDLTKPFPADVPSNMIDSYNKLVATATPEIMALSKTMICVYRKTGDQWTSFYETVTNDTPADLQTANAIGLRFEARGVVTADLPSFKQALAAGGTSRISATPLVVDFNQKL